mmetsp:Transcript_12823/g.21002  ORF Transcript_12823/g.21002 Transcript_12823/m.21002 type:complete len:103 (-) Transcript_12823:63-371(-)
MLPPVSFGLLIGFIMERRDALSGTINGLGQWKIGITRLKVIEQTKKISAGVEGGLLISRGVIIGGDLGAKNHSRGMTPHNHSRGNASLLYCKDGKERSTIER